MSNRQEVSVAPRPYVLGHSERELQRLGSQARLVDPITRRFFREAGIAPGMHVLDVGSGAGDVSFLVADLVGESGSVVGVDRSGSALAAAGARAASQSRRNVTFRQGDPGELEFDAPFDAVVGRYVLQFQTDPGAMLRRLALRVRPGGSIVFHEVDWDGTRSTPPSPLYDQSWRWIVETFLRLGTETHMGARLHATFLAAGLRAPEMRLEAVVAGGPGSEDGLNLITGLLETLQPDMERLGIATASAVDIRSLTRRMLDEVTAGGGVIVGRSEVGAWTTV